MINKKVRLTKKYINWYFTNEAYNHYTNPGTGEVDEDYDRMIETMLLMSMFPDEYPGTVICYSDMDTYRINFPNGHWAWFEPKDLIVQK